MRDTRRAERRLAGLARVRDEELAGLEAGPAARALLSSIVAEPGHPPAPTPVYGRSSRPARRLVLAASALLAMSVAVVAGPSLLPERIGKATSYANSAIEVRQEGDYFVARIKDPLADRSRYVEAFRAVGKDVEIELVPVSPRLVGVRIQAGGDGSGQVRASSELVSAGPIPVDCAVTPASCTLVIRISTDTTGTVRYRVGRAALPGEPTQDPAVPSGVPAPPRGGAGGGTGN
ncbi:hypothetical protein [Plantactinospora sp. WMMB782]|uniref:hypothetical protein n=1 Tax=Plantactinospora sp. WMMB782 TaxID=3404121 RepID=UPI003B9573C4